MKKNLLQVISIFSCLFIITACGQNSSSNNTAASVTPAAESSASQQNQGEEKTETTAKTDLAEKYKDILEALENKEYDKAIDLISAMKPEPETDVVKINLDNWEEYFSIELENAITEYDAMKNIVSVNESWGLVLKPEYKERVVSVNGEVGAEVVYEDTVHKVINVNKDTGAYETEAMDMDSYKSEWEEIMGSLGTPNLVDVDYLESSKTYNLGLDTDIASSRGESIGKNFSSHGGGIIYIKDADAMAQYLRRPQISIVRIEGELVLSK